MHMLRIIQSTSAAGAKKYYGDGLTKGDYYSEERSIEGRWGGRAASLLGLEGAVAAKDFEALCDNIRPGTDGESLTARTDDKRTVLFATLAFPPSPPFIYHSYEGTLDAEGKPSGDAIAHAEVGTRYPSWVSADGCEAIFGNQTSNVYAKRTPK